MPILPIDTNQIVITASRAPENEAQTARQRHHHRPAADRAARRAARQRAAAPDALRIGRNIRPCRVAHRSPNPRRRGKSHLAVRRRHQDQRSGLRRHAAIRDSQRRPRLADRSRPRAAIGVVGFRSDRRRDRRQRRSTISRLRRQRRRRFVRLRSRQRFRSRGRQRRQHLPARSDSSAQPASTASTAAATKTATAICRAGCAPHGTPPPMSSSALRRSRLTGRSRIRRLRSRSPSPTPIRSTAAATGLPPAGYGQQSAATHRRGAGRLPARCSALEPQLSCRCRRRTGRAARGATFRAQVERRFSTGPITHRLIVAADVEREKFHARDTVFGGFTNQDRSRSHQVDHRRMARRGTAMTGDVAVRRDMFNRFKDATSVRARRCWDSSAAGFRWPDPMPKGSPSRLSSISTASFPDISSAIQLLSRKARAGSSCPSLSPRPSALH